MIEVLNFKRWRAEPASSLIDRLLSQSLLLLYRIYQWHFRRFEYCLWLLQRVLIVEIEWVLIETVSHIALGWHYCISLHAAGGGASIEIL